MNPFRGLFTLHVIQCSLHFDKSQKNAFHSLNKATFKLIRKHKNKHTNGQGGIIIQLRAAIFERIPNVQIHAL